jgi:hypothetical protein
VLRTNRSFIGCVLGILVIWAMFLLFIVIGALSSTFDGPHGRYEKTVFYIETSNAQVATYRAATVMARTQSPGR